MSDLLWVIGGIILTGILMSYYLYRTGWFDIDGLFDDFGYDLIPEEDSKEALKISIDWLRIDVLTLDDGRVRVELCGEDYPYEPDRYEFPSLELAMNFVTQETFRLLTEE